MEILDEDLLKIKEGNKKLGRIWQVLFWLNLLAAIALLITIVSLFFYPIDVGLGLGWLVFVLLPSMLIVFINFIIALIFKIRYGWYLKVFKLTDRRKFNFNFYMIFDLVLIFLLFFK